MPDFLNSVAIPTSYGPPPVNLSALGNFFNDYAQGQQNKFAELERQRALQLQQPVNATDPRGMAMELAKRDPGFAAQLLPYLIGQEPGKEIPLQPQAGAGAPSAPLATTAAQPQTTAPAPAPAASGGYSGGDAGTGTVVDIVTGVLPQDSTKTGQVINSIAKAVGADPNAQLTAAQQAKAAKYVQNYAQRNGITVASAAAGQGGDDGSPSPGAKIANVVGDFGVPDDTVGKLIGLTARALRIDPDAPLTPQQQALATRFVTGYVKAHPEATRAHASASGGAAGGGWSPSFDQRWPGGSGAAAAQPGSRVLHPPPANPRPAQAPAQAQPLPQQAQDDAATAPIPGLIRRRI